MKCADTGESDPKYGIQYDVEGYEEQIIPTREGIVAYLSSGQIKGIGPKMAERIYDAFGNMALEVLDKKPEKLLTISGISQNKLKKSAIPTSPTAVLVMW